MIQHRRPTGRSSSRSRSRRRKEERQRAPGGGTGRRCSYHGEASVSVRAKASRLSADRASYLQADKRSAGMTKGRKSLIKISPKLSIRRIHMKFHLFSIHLKFPSYVIFATSGEICEADSQLRRLSVVSHCLSRNPRNFTRFFFFL